MPCPTLPFWHNYASVIYSKVTVIRGNGKISLFTIKMKVAPVPLPRLELCRMHLLVKLLSRVMKSMSYGHPLRAYARCDLWIIALIWLKSSQNRWMIVMVNRTSFISATIPEEKVLLREIFNLLSKSITFSSLNFQMAYPSWRSMMR